MKTEKRRLILRVIAKLMMAGFVIALVYVFMRSLPGPGQQSNIASVDLSTMQAGQLLRYEWSGKRLFILKREALDQAKWHTLSSALLDPDSRHSRQPPAAENSWRSLQPEYFVALDYGTDLNCGVSYLSEHQQGPAAQAWLGGFKDLCRGSWYDLSGRVYKHQRAKRNLTVPAHRIEGQTLLLGLQ